MVRILQYIGKLDIGGSQSMILELYRKIDRTKVQFDFIVSPNVNEEMYNEIIELGGRIYECPIYNVKNIFKYVKWWNKFFKKHTEYKVLHGHIRSVSSIYLHIAKKYGLITIIHSHSTSNGAGIIGKIKDIMQYPARYQADYLFACSEEAGKWMYGKKTICNPNYRIIINAIDAQRFAYNAKTREKIREELKIEDKFVIGTVGRLTASKNHIFLIEIFKNIHKKRQNSVLLIVGDGELKNKLQEQVNRYGIQRNVIFTGAKFNTEDYYQAMDVFAFPSLWEGLGISVVEAQCSGLKCVVSERIPQKVDLKAGILKRVKLEEKQLWIQEILNEYERKNQVDATKKCGYDISENSKKMQEFYIKINEKK